ncbi:DUF2789 domain-containing protein [Moraxella nasibovis]|uniref:DUF2789 family protein n=1 Tax=Moraxella nasibovis TaxID=2904120 RepID=UPI0024107C4B|nr:DUF2789 family protein [Moraxella nasibovis]WFF38219.1 DUF2789 domain-containing protein [Moraxella nasibovis]
MLGEIEYNINQLFAQLGLESSDEAIEAFIRENQLPQETKLVDAPFWSEQQRAFLKEGFELNAVWVVPIDELNVRLHEDAMSE